MARSISKIRLFYLASNSALARLLLIVLLVLPLTACYQLFVKPYGHVARDDDPVRDDGKAVYMPPNAPSILNGFAAKPVFYEDPEGHRAIDIVGPIGTPVLAAATGTVIESYFEPMYGNHILIDHGREEDGRFVRTAYLHLDSRLVEEGARVIRGQQIATLGDTGALAKFLPHLHFEVLLANRRDRHPYETHNPHKFWMQGSGIVTCFDKNTAYPEAPFRTVYPVPCKGVAFE